MKKVLTYTSFIITSLLVILAFITATTYTQLGVAVVFYPFIAFFAYKLFGVRGEKAITASRKTLAIEPPTNVGVDQLETTDLKKEKNAIVADINKRAFLKIIGATGISYFLFSLLNRRSESFFFGRSAEAGISSLTDEGGKKISPSERQPLDGYIISEIDDGYIAYYGFINNNGAWYVMKEDPEDGSFRYIKGSTNFSNNWVSRENLDYDYFHNIFN